jgi:hypothetical protein
MPVFNRNRHSGSSGVAAAYVIENSCRFNDDDSAGTSKDFAAAGNLDLWTISVWVKRGNLGGTFSIWDTLSSQYGYLIFDSNDKLSWYEDTSAGGTTTLLTTQVFRDPSAWMHIVCTYDSAQGVAANRSKLYVNGIQVTAFASESYPDQNSDSATPQDNVMCIGSRDTSSRFFDGYLAEFIYTDGTAYAASDFGETDDNGNWVPIDPSGLTFGTNGFYLDFAVAPGTGNGAGTDVSGEANHFTDSGLAANDQVTDSPSDSADDNLGNYPTLSSIVPTPSGGRAICTLSNGNLRMTCSLYNGIRTATPVMDYGYWEVECISKSGAGYRIFTGLCEHDTDFTQSAGGGISGRQGIDGSWVTFIDGDDAGTTDYTGDWVAGEVACFAVRQSGSNVHLWIREEDEAWFGGGNPVENTSATLTFSSLDVSELFVFGHGYNSSDILEFNFGQLGFSQTPPTGFKAMMTANLPAPTITDPSKFFQVDTFTGTGAELVRTLTDASGAAVKPDLVWIKDRDTVVKDVWCSRVHAATNQLSWGTNGAIAAVAQGLKSFDTSGYTLGTDTGWNASSSPNVARCWVIDGTTGSSNSDGAVTSNVAVNATAGISEVTWTGTGSATTIGHGLGSTPEFYIHYNTTQSGPLTWHHKYEGTAGGNQFLDTTIAVEHDGGNFNSTDPTSTVWSAGTYNQANQSSVLFSNFFFVGVDGYSKFGSYEGNGNADGTFVWCGFRPAMIWCKSIDSTSDWFIYDHLRDGYNVDNDYLIMDTAAENTANQIDILSNGFKMRITTDPNVAETYVFAAFAEFPFGGVDVSQARAR